MNFQFGWLACLFLSCSTYAHAENWFTEGDNFNLQLGFYTRHFNPSPEHLNHNQLVALEYQVPTRLSFGAQFGADKNVFGFSTFKNSFSQPSQYAYAGWIFNVNEMTYVKLTAGLIHGYKDEYQDKIPFNGSGIAPAVIPALGFKYRRFSLEGILLGSSAFMASAGFAF